MLSILPPQVNGYTVLKHDVVVEMHNREMMKTAMHELGIFYHDDKEMANTLHQAFNDDTGLLGR